MTKEEMRFRAALAIITHNYARFENQEYAVMKSVELADKLLEELKDSESEKNTTLIKGVK